MSTQGVNPTRDVYDPEAVAARESQVALVYSALVTVVFIVVWAGVAALSRRDLGWVPLVMGLAVGFSVRLCSVHFRPGLRAQAGIVVLLGALFGRFLAACAARDIMPYMVLAHWGAVAEHLFATEVFGPSTLMLYGAAVALSVVIPSIGRVPVSHHAR